MFRLAFTRRRLLLSGATAAAVGGGLVVWRLNSVPPTRLQHPPFPSPDHLLHADSIADAVADPNPNSLWTPPTRREMLNLLKGLNKDGSQPTGKAAPAKSSFWGKPQQATPGGDFDLLVVGGGATGVGCAVDAATRGLKVALVERDDFASGTSSRSTKLVHGGVRYLEKAFLEADYEQYKLVCEALHERGVFLKIAPYLSYQLPIMLPIYQYWKVPYYWAGSKAYDLLAGSEGLSRSYFLGKRKALEAFPMLKTDRLVGAMVYYDGAHNDSRMNVAIALTAVSQGAVVANHVEVIELLKRPRTTHVGAPGLGDQELYGAVVRDTLTGDTWTVRAKGIINATGPFSDGLRKMDTGIETKEIVAPSAGVHIILPNYYSPRRMGLVDPSTSDGRVIFFLPWQGNTIAGTTDSPTSVSADPMPTETDVTWILNEIENYLDPNIKVRRGDVLAAWSGIRPLVRDPSAKNTAALVRNHMINVSESGLLTIAGGKWTTYRNMAQETIDKAIETYDLKPTGPCVTERVLLVGSHNWSANMFIKLIQTYGLETEVAQHLADSYGDRAFAVASLASLSGHRWPIFGKRLVSTYPYIEAEVRYAVQREYACTAVDVLARRTRLAFLNCKAAKDVLPRVIDIMTEELGWSKERKAKEYENGIRFLRTMGLDMAPTSTAEEEAFFSRSHFAPAELEKYRSQFNRFEKKGKDDSAGYIAEKDLTKVLTRLGIETTKHDVENAVGGVHLNKKGVVEFNEFLEVIGAVKEQKLRSKYNQSLGVAGETREQFSTPNVPPWVGRLNGADKPSRVDFSLATTTCSSPTRLAMALFNNLGPRNDYETLSYPKEEPAVAVVAPTASVQPAAPATAPRPKLALNTDANRTPISSEDAEAAVMFSQISESILSQLQRKLRDYVKENQDWMPEQDSSQEISFLVSYALDMFPSSELEILRLKAYDDKVLKSLTTTIHEKGTPYLLNLVETGKVKDERALRGLCDRFTKSLMERQVPRPTESTWEEALALIQSDIVQPGLDALRVWRMRDQVANGGVDAVANLVARLDVNTSDLRAGSASSNTNSLERPAITPPCRQQGLPAYGSTVSLQRVITPPSRSVSLIPTSAMPTPPQQRKESSE
ncbi:mitochondrial glycerol-3-phosphate dehydrogenase [Irineochytrium annulatum]|nr:mitochondrial glycerol-3-phosphate dehydrogenase [Irineochytrium annulatum]